MKSILTFVLALLTYSSIAQEDSTTSIDSNAFLNKFGSHLFIPMYSEIEWTDNNFTVVPPEGWKYVFRTMENGKLEAVMKVGNAGVSCDCILNENGAQGGCHPELSNQGAFGCKMTEECNTCQKMVTLTSTNRIYALESKGSGYVNMQSGIDFADDTDSLPLAFSAMFEIPEIQNAIDQFVGQIYDELEVPELSLNEYGQLIAPEGFVFSLINIFGRAAVVLIPEGSMVEGRIEIPKVECTCEISGTCEPFPNGPVITCYSTCQGACTLEVKKRELLTYTY